MKTHLFKSVQSFRNFVWVVLVYNILVILWGAFVRATGSGAGCGAHWPLCNGEVIPRAPALETIIEFTHRISSGLVLVFAVVVVLSAFRIFPKGHLVRISALAVGIFTIIEALIGAVLVLNELTGQNDSIHRALVMMVHLINTFLLVAAIFLTARWSVEDSTISINFNRGRWSFVIGIGLIGMMVLGASGAVTALGDTLYPSSSLVEGFRQDFDPTANILIRLRVFHPAIAALVGVYTIGAALFFRRKFPSKRMYQATYALSAVYALQLFLGVLNVILLAPVWMQILHLLVTNLIWLAWLWLAELFFNGRFALQGRDNHAIHQSVRQPLAE
ncbi:MAG: COX15/CtaA family protein [Chloroflexota bacterium]